MIALAFGYQLVATVLANLAVAGMVFFFIERRFQLGAQRAQRAELAIDMLGAVKSELELNRQVAETMRVNLPKGVLPYTAFEVTGWDLLSQSQVFTALEAATTKPLVEVYGALRAANDQHAMLLDLMYGPTSALAFLTAQAAPRDHAENAMRRIDERRGDLRDRLLRRIEYLEPILSTTIDQIDTELAMHHSG